ncbi:2-amino-4-hydroxy-6-hydroxymethyldihydropteridine diphosphokinase [Hahella sp. SMD15-11]|uniref:2-amino-4-hydroxy-6-hydroxymethyldihydropteridine diphosphokinase n=1 Tax=Thermohahella caldifontis TaxID=3142973 RepID=A0AB39UV74_9GAMM
MAVEVVLGLGSNLGPDRHIPRACDTLRGWLAGCRFSRVYACPPVGFEGPDYWNLIACGATDLPLSALKARLVALERQSGRTGNEPPLTGRTLDIDILFYGDWQGRFGDIELPRPGMLSHAYTLRPLAELLPQRVHPGTGRTLADHWADYPGPDDLVPVSYVP